MKLVGKLTRVEKLAGKGSCPLCRLTLRHHWPDPSKPNPGPKDHALILSAHCKLCGRKYNVDLSHHPSDLLHMFRIYYGSTMEEEYKHPHAWAAGQWAKNYFTAWLGRRYFTGRKISKQTPYPQQQTEHERQASSDFKLFSELRAEYKASRERALKRLAARYGDSPFPDLASLIDSVKSKGYAHLYKGEPFHPNISVYKFDIIESEATAMLKCAEAEKIVMGITAPSTVAALAECERRALAEVEAAKLLREHDELVFRKAMEPVLAERERMRLLREAAQRGPAPSAPPAPKEPTLTGDQRRDLEPLIDNGTLAASARRSAEARAALGHRPQPPDHGAAPAQPKSPHNRRSQRTLSWKEITWRSGA